MPTRYFTHLHQLTDEEAQELKTRFEEYLQWLKDHWSLVDLKPIPEGRIAALNRLPGTTHLLIYDVGDKIGPIDRWCYESYAKALHALQRWDGVGEPTDWDRHPASGRVRIKGDMTAEYTNRLPPSI